MTTNADVPADWRRCRKGHWAHVDDMARKRGEHYSICRAHDAADAGIRMRARRAADPDYERDRRTARREAGMCREHGCLNPPVPGRTRCSGCGAAHRADHRARSAANTARTDTEITRDRTRLRPDGTKRCRGCRRVLDLDEFADNRSRADGLRNECRACDGTDLLRAATPHIEAMDLWSCVYCDAPSEHIDHVIPRALGGSDDAVNLVPACAAHNSSKSATPVREWLVRVDPELLAITDRWPVEVVPYDPSARA